MHIYVYIYIFIHMYVYIYIYIYTRAAAEATKEHSSLYAASLFIVVIFFIYIQDPSTHIHKVSTDEHMYIYICIYVYVYMCIYIYVYMCIYI